ncbi:hypothetical protein J2X42_002542 [Arthrobacter sp. BE255]|jgi:hypothetical protein|nr:hypothetical protein [Arthrobacter sp. BE255]
MSLLPANIRMIATGFDRDKEPPLGDDNVRLG